jgi:glycosyltransferase involved in cell wall biosynthesis
MRFGIDFRPALFGGAGIGRCTREICRALPGLLHPGEEAVLFGVAFKKPEQALIRDIDFKASPNVKIVRGRFPNRILNLLGRMGLTGLENFTGKLDLFLYTDFVYPSLKSTPSCMMLYDLLFMREESGFHSIAFCRSLQKRVGAALARARGVVVPSRAVQEDLERYFPEARLPVRVIPMGGDHLPEPKAPDKGPRPSSGRYFLSVGTMEPRKNRLRILEAFERVASDLPGIQLVVAGRAGWMDDPFQERLKSSIQRSEVLLLPDPDDAYLSWLYRNAIALVYPSLGEGFGIPVAEAMTQGCPVITSNRSSMPEVARGAARLVDPLDVSSIAESLVYLINNEKVRDRMILDGTRRSSELTWRSTASQILDFLREILRITS